MEDIKIIKGRVFTGCIYKATCTLDGTVYIGQTTNFEARKKKHLLAGEHHGDIGYYDTFHTAIKENGKDAFVWEIVESIIVPDVNILITTLLSREKFYISEYLKVGKVYNRENKKVKEYKNVLQYSMHGKFIKKWSSLTDVVSELGLDAAKVEKCLHGARKWVGNFRWLLQVGKNIPIDIGKHTPVKKRKQAIGVAAYDLDGNFVKSFDTLSEAAKYFGMPIVSVSKCVCGERKLSHGHQFVGDSGDGFPEKIPPHVKIGGTPAKPVNQYLFGGKFVARHSSLAEACAKTSVSENVIRRYCEENITERAIRGFTFSWAE